jgi:hypothetical protein
MSDILAITTPEDPHVDMVEEKLGGNEKIWIYDPSKFPDDTNITFYFDGEEMAIHSEGRNLNEVRSVWFRKPKYLKPDEHDVPPEYMEFTHDAYEYGVKALYDLLRDKFWMSPFRSIMTANNKVLQLELAREVGFSVPATMLTNNPSDAISFRDEFQYIVAKSLAFSPVKVGDDLYSFYTTRISPDNEIDFSGLPVSPTLFQEEVQDKIDVRVTIVGDEIFPCLIRPTKSVEGEVDWREGIMSDEVSYQVFHDFPEEMASKCVEMVQKLGLSFSAMEFALDSEGNYWFIENNPNGQWAFIEEETGMPIAESIAELLWKGGKR